MAAGWRGGDARGAGTGPDRGAPGAVTRASAPTSCRPRGGRPVDFGEATCELVAKAGEVESELESLDDSARPAYPRWHFIGRLQRNKVRKAAPFVALWHSVDRLSLGAEIARWAPGAAVLLQVNTSGEEAKAGCTPAMRGVAEGR